MSIYDGALWLFGSVGNIGAEDGEFFTHAMVRQALATHGSRPLSVYINSYGGLADEGVAIHNLLKSHAGKITVTIDGLAASASSLIAMAGADIAIRRGSLMMIHDPSVVAGGTANDLEKTASSLHILGDQMAEIYASRSGKSVTKVRNMMIAETWFSPEEAVRQGFADRVDIVVSKAAASTTRRAGRATAAAMQLGQTADGSRNVWNTIAANYWTRKRTR